MPQTLSLLKTRLRVLKKAERLALAPEKRQACDAVLNQRLGEWLERLASHPIVGFYYPLAAEVNLLPTLATSGNVTCLPVITGQSKRLAFYPWRQGEGLQSGPHGVQEPAQKTDSLEPDIVLVPVLAFDRSGRRLGYGGGYYDATLAGLRARKPITAVGIAYDFQESAGLPEELFDQRLDLVITQKEIISCPS